MEASRNSFELFIVSDGASGEPRRLDPVTFSGIGALELQDIERWIRERPLVLGEDLKIVTHQFAGFEGAKDRLDVLAIDCHGRLVVVEIKRDTSGAHQDLQALRYAAFVSTFRADQLAEAHVEYVRQSEDREIDLQGARRELEAFIDGGDLDVVDEDVQPRIMLVAAGFQPAVTSTVIWLTRSFGLNITCVQLVPYEVAGQLLLCSSILLPLREAGDYEVRVAEKARAASRRGIGAPLDHEQALAFITSIPEGHWTAYKDVAIAGGSPNGAMGVGSWLSSAGDSIPNVYRVLNTGGEVSDGWKTNNPDLPPSPDDVRICLKGEGVRFTPDGRADPDQRWTVKNWHPNAPDHKNASAVHT
jgi:alkylated DNA nucleotide flippase Atl1